MRTRSCLLPLMAAALAPIGPAWGLGGAGREDALRKLDTLKVSVDFKDATLDEAVEVLRQATGLNFVVQEGGRRRVRMTLRDLSARSVLKLMLGPLDLGAEWRDGAVVIVPRRALEKRLVCRIYDARGALVKLRDAPGPKIELTRLLSGGGPLTGLF